MLGNILLVDDDRDLRDVLTEALKFEGYAVTPVAHGGEALAHLRGGGRPCLILLDVMMPVMDGRTFREQMLKDPALQNIPVVLITAGGQQIADTIPADRVLHKPLRIELVLDAVQSYCTPTRI